MDQPRQRFTGIFLPVELLELTNITMNEKLLLAVIDSLYSKSHGGCFASDEYLATKLGLKLNTLQKSMTKLRKLGYVENVKNTGRGVIRRAKIHKIVEESQSRSDLDKNPVQDQETWIKIQDTPGKKSKTELREQDPPLYNYIKEDIKVLCSDTFSDEKGHEPDPPKKALDSLTFNKAKRCFENVHPQDLDRWRCAYPDVSIEKEMAQAIDWLIANPAKANKKNWLAFLQRWFKKQQDRMEVRSYGTQKKSRKDHAYEQQNLKHIQRMEEKW